MIAADENAVNGDSKQEIVDTTENNNISKENNANENDGDSEKSQEKGKPDKKFLHRPGVRLGPLLEKDIVPTQEEVTSYQDALSQIKDILNNSPLKVQRVFEVILLQSATC